MRRKFAQIVVFAASVSSPLLAQIPAISEIPACAVGVQRTQLERRRDELVSNRNQLKSRTGEHNARCGQVPEGSPQENDCRSQQSSLNQGIAAYAGAVRAFNADASSACNLNSNAHPQIGSTAAVRGTVYWLTSDGRHVPVTNGSTLDPNARLVTGQDGHAEILFLDETVITLGPNSEFVLDEFAYDPETSAGKVAASVVQGTLHWVTGKMGIHAPKQMKVSVPAAVLAVRGTDFEVFYQPGQQGTIRLFSGLLQLTERKSGREFDLHAGQMVFIGVDGSLSAPQSIAKD